MKKILFLCVANSIRSQIAEGIGNQVLTGIAKVCSAGIESSRVHPYSILVLQEIGIDISHHQSKSINSIDLSQIDLIITLCGEEYCQELSTTIEKLHWPLPDPIHTNDNPEQQLEAFRQVRDELRHRIEKLKIKLQNE